jgi:hypothetical protein
MSRNSLALPNRLAAVVALVVAAALVLLPQGSTVFAGTYQPCQLPVVVGSTVRPNVMIVQDMSGSMQSAAYYNSYLEGYYSNSYRGYPSEAISPLSGITAYQMDRGYYGTADTDTYYKYNATGNSTGGYFEEVPDASAPSHRFQFTDVSKKGSTDTEIVFTAAGHTFVVGDWVAFYNLSSHVGLNSDALQVIAVSGDTFTIGAEWNGTGDSTAGQAIKRVIEGTSFSGGLNGTVLNWLLTTRTDASVKAFIGGRAAYSDTDYHYLQYQGMRRFVVDEALGCLAHIRHATTSTAGSTSPSYTSGTYYGVQGDSANPTKDMYMTASNFWKGRLNANNPNSKRGGTNKKAQVYTFTLTTSATVTLRMFPADPVNDDWTTRLYLYYAAAPSSSSSVTYATDDGTTDPSSTTDGCAVITRTLNAGTYSIEATSSSTNVYKSYYLAVTFEEDTNHARGSDPSVTLAKDTTDAYHDGTLFTSYVGGILNAQCRIQQPKAKRSGVVQNSFNTVRFGFMYFNSTSGRQGKMLVSCDNTNLDTLINAFSGIGSQSYYNGSSTNTISFTDCYPYNGTPTGEALQNAYNYFTQSSTYSTGASNTPFYPFQKKIVDPYYGPETDATGKPMAVICRKSYVLLVSDGEWNGSEDPVRPARLLHYRDLRTDLANPTTTTHAGTTVTPQTVTVYTIFAFSNSEAGTNAMKFTAMYGSFTDVSTCTNAEWPYPMTDYPKLTTDSKYPNSLLQLTASPYTITPFWDYVTKCDGRDPLPTGHSYNTDCCAEWDTVMERTGEKKDSQKGLPDTYFEASDGQQLETSLKAVLQQVLAQDASASAVATVSQQLSTGDTVIRGVFQASDPENTEKFLWYGHLEAYWPFRYTEAGEHKVGYEFDLHPDDRCEERPESDRRCWDGGLLLKTRKIADAGEGRKIFTAVYDTSTKKWSRSEYFKTDPTIYPTAAMLGVASDTAATNLIDWVLGKAVSGLRIRAKTLADDQHRLGDVVYSTPVIGGPPSPGAVSSNDPNISEFYKYRNRDKPKECQGSGENRKCRTGSDVFTQEEILHRDKVVFVGSNDGMVHAFLLAKWNSATNQQNWQDRPSDAKFPLDGEDGKPDPRTNDIGRELWAYVPSNFLKSLNALASDKYGTSAVGGCVHRPMVDLSSQVYEVYIHDRWSADGMGTGMSSERMWRSVLIGGERGGGDTYFALDVTDPHNPIVLWEYSVLKDRVVYDSNKWYQPFGLVYDSISNFPMSWTQPALGRLHLPSGVTFYVGAPNSTNAIDTSSGPKSFTIADPPADDPTARHVVFVGGGIHLFDNAFTTSPDPPTGYTSTLWSTCKKELFKSSLIVLDIDEGYNLFKYVWPSLVTASTPAVFPEIIRSTSAIPYAMSDPVAIDVWDPGLGSASDDGFTDRVYMGDTTGRFYSLKFTSPTASPAGIQVDVWKTKEIASTDGLNSNYLRSGLQPISQSPSISFESPQSGVAPYLRAIFASGKYEDITGSTDDKTDEHRTSLYNLRDLAAMPTLSGATSVLGTGFYFKVTSKWINTFSTGCTWINSSGDPDCCQQSGCGAKDSSGYYPSACFQCVYDLTQPLTGGPAERFTAKPLIAGDLVFATSFMPSSNPCDYTGYGFLYIFNYLCDTLPDDFKPITDPLFTPYLTTIPEGASGSYTGVRLDLGAGMPSRPVLDSSGKNVIVQMSDGTLKRVPVNLKAKPVQVQGWQEK